MEKHIGFLARDGCGKPGTYEIVADNGIRVECEELGAAGILRACSDSVILQGRQHVHMVRIFCVFCEHTPCRMVIAGSC